jgi:hypothetical protein
LKTDKPLKQTLRQSSTERYTHTHIYIYYIYIYNIYIYIYRCIDTKKWKGEKEEEYKRREERGEREGIEEKPKRESS